MINDFMTHNEPVGKVLLTSENDVFGGNLTLPKYEIVDFGAFCEVIFFYISPKNLLGDFFYSLNVRAHRRPAAQRSVVCVKRVARGIYVRNPIHSLLRSNSKYPP
jgi:hypothetical protein